MLRRWVPTLRVRFVGVDRPCTVVLRRRIRLGQRPRGPVPWQLRRAYRTDAVAAGGGPVTPRSGPSCSSGSAGRGRPGRSGGRRGDEDGARCPCGRSGRGRRHPRRRRTVRRGQGRPGHLTPQADRGHATAASRELLSILRRPLSAAREMVDDGPIESSPATGSPSPPWVSC